MNKAAVKAHWEAESCGIRYGRSEDRSTYFAEITAARYRLEPFIPHFADFPSAQGKSVLEIGVGAATDFTQWARYAEQLTGVDLTEAAVELARERVPRADVRVADAELLPFAEDTFDIVYSWGVLHHTPDTGRAFAEAARVLRPGGVLKAMVYHSPSWTLFMLWALQAVRGRFKSLRQIAFDHLESPGTKAYSVPEALRLLKDAGLELVAARTQLGPGDLLKIRPSARYQGLAHRLIWKLYPRGLVRVLGNGLGLYLLLEARKPVRA